jgi:4-carboxymuconolactone decarboxylase
MNPRKRSVIVVSALYASGKPQRVDRWLRTNKAAHRIGRLFFEELFIHLSLLLGFPAMIDGLERLSMHFPTASRRRRKQKSAEGGSSLLQRVYGDQAARLLANLGSFHPELPTWVVKDVYGKVFARRGLTLSERELANVVVLSFQNLEKQLRSHIRGAQRVGLSLADLNEALALAMRSTGHKRLRGATVLRTVVSQKKKT